MSEPASGAARVTRVALVGSARACARLQREVEGMFAIAGTFPDLASARAASPDADAFLVANEGGAESVDADSEEAGAEDPVFMEPLTEREIEVLERLAEGLSNKGIAARLGISDQTVKFHVASISGKLGTHTRTETVRRAVRSGLISL